MEFLGIHWGQFPEKWEIGEKDFADTEASLIVDEKYIKGVSGMTCVAPSWSIMEVLYMPEMKQERDQALQQLRKSLANKPLPPIEESARNADAVDVDTIQEQQMEVDICIKGAPKTLDLHDCASLCGGFGKTGFVDQMRGNGAVDDAQYLAHNGGLPGKQKAQRERYAEHPLTHGLMRKEAGYLRVSSIFPCSILLTGN